MQKVYLLLRNNQQTGPYSLEELSQLQLKNTDLIWIEGKSAGWYYPYELPDVKPIFDRTMALKKQESAAPKQPAKKETTPVQPNVDKTTKAPIPPKKIYVSMPNAPVAAKSPAIEPKPAVSEPKAVESKKVDEIEQRAEELRRRIQAYPAMKEQAKAAAIQQQENKTSAAAQTITPTYQEEEASTFTPPSKSFEPARKEEPVLKHRLVQEKHTSENRQELYDSTPNLTGSRRRSVSSPVLQYAAVLFMLALLIGAGWWMFKSFSAKEQQNESAGQQVANPVQQTTVPASNTQDPNTIATNQMGDTSISSGTAKVSAAINATVSNKPKQVPVTTVEQPKPVSSENTSISENHPANVAPVQTATPTTNDNTNVPPVVVAKKDNTIAENPNAVPAEDQGQKKESFFSKLFRKRTKEEPTTADATGSNPQGERNSTRREETTSAPSPAAETNITDQVQVSLNTPEDKWMMGVSGLRVTMTNNSNADLKRAAVDVIYYNDQNEVIQRRTVYFNNIRPGKSRSVAAPDHKTADHAGFKIISAVGVQK